MKSKLKKWIRPALFILGGALAGLVYYYFVGCPSGSCSITSTPLNAMVYMGIVGWLLSIVFGNDCPGGCDM
ncbi:MAG: DUF6132 family protein [Agathobaculum sp.]|jgi:hypothetical protein|uniref:DUF6132 family protein n=1 Tax=Agathobaculum sp. TaxID=2048138 RepID=UPI003D90D876